MPGALSRPGARCMNDPADLQAWRRVQRKNLLARREAVPAEQRRAWNGHVTHLLDAGFPLLRQMCVGFCWPFRGEFDARFLARTLRLQGASTALPEVVARDAPLRFRAWWPGVATTRRVFDLPVPDGTAIVTPDALLIPPVGFDARGYRLGYGGGFFDRTLAAYPVQPLRIGVAFEVSRMPTIHPQQHDVRMDFIVTEAGIFMVEGTGLMPIDAAECAQRARRMVADRQG
jgi:5,10-methenyltetrahydrofolate synthetase